VIDKPVYVLSIKATRNDLEVAFRLGD